MMGRTLALVRRSLRVDIREKRSHLFRALLAAVILMSLTSTQLNYFSTNAQGLILFGWIAYLNYWFITFAGATFFASAITEEKEERTLGLMKMAGVGPLAVLIGKWLPRLIGAVLLIAVQFPFTVLSITLGGVLWHQILAAYIILLAHLFLVGNLGLLMSVLCNSTTRACGFTVLILFIFHGLPFPAKVSAQALLQQGHISPWTEEIVSGAADAVIGCTGFYGIMAALSTGFNEPLFTTAIWVNLGFGAVLFGLAWALFEPCTRNEVESGPGLSWHRRLGNLFRRGRQSSARRAWSWAVVWKDYYLLSGGPVTGAVKFLLYGGSIAGILYFIHLEQPGGSDRHAVAGVSIWIGCFAAAIELAVQVARLYRAEINDKTWSTLCMLPYSIPHLAYAKLGGCLLGLLPALFYVAFGCMFVLDDVLSGLWDLLGEPEGIAGVTYFLLMVLLGLHLAVYFSISARWAVWPAALFLAYASVVMINMVIMPIVSYFSFFAGGGSRMLGVFLVMDIGWFCVTALLHWLIGKKLADLAAES